MDYDERCYDLAVKFLGESNPPYAVYEDLAQAIQNAIENYLEAIRKQRRQDLEAWVKEYVEEENGFSLKVSVIRDIVEHVLFEGRRGAV